MNNERAFYDYDNRYQDDSYDDNDIIIDATPRRTRNIRRNKKRWLDLELGLASVLIGLVGAMFIIAATIVGLYVLVLHFMFIAWAFALGLTALPALGIGYAVLFLHSQYKKANVIAVAPQGTILRARDGSLQIISPVELNAYETQAPVPLMLPSLRSERLITEQPDIPSLANGLQLEMRYPDTQAETLSETVSETAIETVPETLSDAVSVKRKELQSAEDELRIKQIQNLYEARVPLRLIAATLHLGGEKYSTQFVPLLVRAGIRES